MYEQDKVKSFFSWVQSITTDRCPLPIVNNQLLAFKIRFQPTVGQKGNSCSWILVSVCCLSVGHSYAENRSVAACVSMLCKPAICLVMH